MNKIFIKSGRNIKLLRGANALVGILVMMLLSAILSACGEKESVQRRAVRLQIFNECMGDGSRSDAWLQYCECTSGYFVAQYTDEELDIFKNHPFKIENGRMVQNILNGSAICSNLHPRNNATPGDSETPEADAEEE